MTASQINWNQKLLDSNYFNETDDNETWSK